VPFSFELRLLRGGEKNEEVLICHHAGGDSRHQHNILGNYGHPHSMECSLPDRSPAQLRSYIHPRSVVLAERWGSAPHLPAVRPAASGKD